jgi:hypothetical protein
VLQPGAAPPRCSLTSSDTPPAAEATVQCDLLRGQRANVECACRVQNRSSSAVFPPPASAVTSATRPRPADASSNRAASSASGGRARQGGRRRRSCHRAGSFRHPDRSPRPRQAPDESSALTPSAPSRRADAPMPLTGGRRQRKVRDVPSGATFVFTRATRTTAKPSVAVTFKPSDGLEPSTPSLPWRCSTN